MTTTGELGLSNTSDHEHTWNWKGWLFGREGSGEIHYCTICHLMRYEVSKDYEREASVKKQALTALATDTRTGRAA
jgi:hypothetical protein